MAVAPLGKILLYVDATEQALDAARYAVALAKKYGAELHAAFVVDEKMLDQLLQAKVFVEEEELDLKQDLEDDGRRYLAHVETMAGDKGLEITTELLRGMVHREIVDVAARIGASLIVIGEIEEPVSRRDSFYDEAQMILWSAKCPVLVVRGETIAEDFYDSV